MGRWGPSRAGWRGKRRRKRRFFHPCHELYQAQHRAFSPFLRLALPRSVASLCTETLPLLAVTFITENSLVAAVSLGWL